MTTRTTTQYQHLEPRPGSNHRQLFLKGRRIQAAVVDEAIHGPDARTPEEFARDYQVPLESVLEAFDYVAQNRPLIEQDRDREAAKLRARGLDGPDLIPGASSGVGAAFRFLEVLRGDSRSLLAKPPRKPGTGSHPAKPTVDAIELSRE